MTDDSTKQVFTSLLWSSIDSGFTNAAKQIITAHGAMESGWGSSKAFTQGNNPFNLTRLNDVSGAIVQGNDVEFDKGEMKRITQRFAAYSSLEDAVVDYVGFIKHSRYADAYECLCLGDVDAYFTRLQAGHFFTLPMKQYMAAINSCLTTVKSFTTSLECV